MKKYLLGILAIVFAISFSAFTVPPETSKAGLNLKYFTYDDWPVETWIADPSHYTMTTSDGEDPFDCPGTQFVCGVRAEEDGDSGEPMLEGATPYHKDIED